MFLNLFTRKTQDEIFLENYKDDYVELQTFQHLLQLISSSKVINTLEHLNTGTLFSMKSFFNIELRDNNDITLLSFTPREPISERKEWTINKTIDLISEEIQQLLRHLKIQYWKRNLPFDVTTIIKWNQFKELVCLIIRKNFWANINSKEIFESYWDLSDEEVQKQDEEDFDLTSFITERQENEEVSNSFSFSSYDNMKSLWYSSPISFWLNTSELDELCKKTMKCNTIEEISKLLLNLDIVKHSNFCILFDSFNSSTKFREDLFWVEINNFVTSKNYSGEDKYNLLKDSFILNIKWFTGDIPEYIKEKAFARLYTDYFKVVVLAEEERKRISEEEKKQKEIKAEEERKLKNFQAILKLKPLDKDLQESVQKMERVLEIRNQFITLNQELKKLS